MDTFDFERLLQESSRMHGHLCPGQVLGVKMAILGLRSIGIEEPRGKDRKKLIVFVEMDRCATDAIQSVTGCSLGHRTMKFLDYGKMAATFTNIATGKSVRVAAREDARTKAKECFPGNGNTFAAQIEAYKILNDEDLFDVMDVRVSLGPEDMPGRPLKRVRCDLCGEYVQDMREVSEGGRTVCKPCAGEGYYTAANAYDVTARSDGTKTAMNNPPSPPSAMGRRGGSKDAFLLPGVMQKSHSDMEIRSKLWIEVKGQPVFGRGRRLLLRAIEKHGSINQAAKEISISYRKAWSYLKSMEERLGIKLVERQSGGRNGGGASLTEEAMAFLNRYEGMEEGIREIVDQRFREIFGGQE